METGIAETGTMTMAALLSTITEVFTAATGWMASVAEIVVANPLFLIPIVFTFIGVGITLSPGCCGCKPRRGEAAREHSARPSPRYLYF